MTKPTPRRLADDLMESLDEVAEAIRVATSVEQLLATKLNRPPVADVERTHDDLIAGA